MVTETDLELSDGRTLHGYDAAAEDVDTRLVVFWHHGTPNLGTPPEPLLPAAAERGIRWVSYDRPGYGGSTPHPGRDLASAAADVSSIADAFGIGRLAVMGHSGGAAHALACAALLPERVLPRCARPAWLRTTPRGSTGSRAWGPPPRRICVPPPRAVRRSSTTWRPPSSTRSCSPQRSCRTRGRMVLARRHRRASPGRRPWRDGG